MQSVLFVHGTGVRQPSYDDSFATIEAHLKKRLPQSQLYPCYWGGTAGSRLGSGGASIPDYNTARAVEEIDAADAAIAEWRLLYEDPDSELDFFLGAPGASEGFVPAAATPFEQVNKLLNTETPKTRQLQQALKLQSAWEPAKALLLKTLSAAIAAKRSVPQLTSEFRAVLARSLVAHASVIAFAESDSARDWPDGAARDELVKALQEAWGDDRGLVGGVATWIGNRLKRVALNIGTNRVSRKRGAVSDASSPAAGDVLLYQTRGEGIRKYIEDAIRGAPKPLMILAHSLGGIACVDLLASKRIDGVSHLITVGSQAPLLYELDALWSLPHGTPLPESVPRWLNIYDKHDFLSYIGAKIFPGRVIDVSVDNKQPFPQSHSAYWSNPAVWDAIAGV